MRFHNPYFLIFLVSIPFLLYLYASGRYFTKGGIKFSDLRLLRRTRPSFRVRLRHVPFALRSAGLFLLIIALARPQSGMRAREVSAEGVDIVLTLDVSPSMKAIDFGTESRIDICKRVVKDFINGREGDRLGLVIFAAQAVTHCPLTLDYDVLTSFLDEIEAGMLGDGTAIGTAIGVATNRLLRSDAKSRVIVLLTDGVNNMGEIDPITAAKAAKAVGVKIYTIGAGRRGQALVKLDDVPGGRYVTVESQVDEESLREIADVTGGRYYRATDSLALRKVFEEIGKLEKTKIRSKEYMRYSEMFEYFLIPGLALILFGVVLGNTALRRIP